VLEGGQTSSRRLPFTFQTHGAVGRLTLTDLTVGGLAIDRLELEVSDLGTDPGASNVDRYQRRRTRLRSLAVRAPSQTVEDRVVAVRRHLASLGITQLAARLGDGFISVRARATDGLAAADLSFHVQLVNAGTHVRALASAIRVHGHLPTPGPVIADRILSALLGASDAPNVIERPHTRGLCDVEIDLVNAVLWHLMPPSGWRLPAVGDIELVHVRIGRGAVEIAYGPPGTRSGELGVRVPAAQLAAAHDLMHSVDEQLRSGHYEEAMRGYRALLAAGGPDQPFLLERILALAAARPVWFFDGLELARQALGRWPQFAPAHAALAAITLSQGDAREAASHLSQLAQLASAEGDDDQAALAALAGARLLRVLEPRAATQLYSLALEHDPASTEAADSLADRLTDEQRWTELVRLARARALTSDVTRAVQLRLRLADVFVQQLGDLPGAQQELAAARELAPDEPAVHEMTAKILSASDPDAATAAWREVARIAEARSDNRTAARAYARLGDLVTGVDADRAWQRALELDGLQVDAIVGLAQSAANRGDHAVAAELYERLRGLGLAPLVLARHELALARSLVALERGDDARISLRRATLAGGETAAEAHAVLAEIAEATSDREHAAAELDTAITSLVDLASEDSDGDRLYTRAAELAVARAQLLERTGQPDAAIADWQRAHALAQIHAPEIARNAARTLLARAGDDARVERRWIDALLVTRPPAGERAALLVRRADVRRRERTPDVAAAIADLHEALALTEPDEGTSSDEAITDSRRRAYQLEAELLAQSGDQRARAQALAALAKMAVRTTERVEVETAAAAAWLAADEPAAALPHGARAHATLDGEITPALRHEVLVTLGEAAWRQRAWPDVIRAYRGLVDDPGDEGPRVGTFRYRLAVAADRTGDAELAAATLRPMIDPEAASTTSAEVRGHALRLYADLCERSGDLAGAAAALETFASLAVETSASARADAMYRAGELYRRAQLADPKSSRGEDAIRCLETALRISDAHLPALDALELAWRERGDLERVSVILGRKVAATARHPSRQKPLLSRLGDLQDQLSRPDVALATHQRALEIDPTWRPSLRYVTVRLRDNGAYMSAVNGFAQLAGELPGDAGVDFAIVNRERLVAAYALSELIAKLDDSQLEAVRKLATHVLERAKAEGADVTVGLARLHGELGAKPKPRTSTDENTQSGRARESAGTALSLRDAAKRARASGKLDDALATLETANHVNPGDRDVLRDLVDLAGEIGDHEAAARHLTALADLGTGARKADLLLELADIFYDRVEDAVRARKAMRAAAEAFGGGMRRDATLRLLGTEAGAHLAWDVAVDAMTAIPPDRRTKSDTIQLATALTRAGRDADAIFVLEQAMQDGRLEDGAELLAKVKAEVERKRKLVLEIEKQAASALPAEAVMLRAEALQLRHAIGMTGADDDEWVSEDDVVAEADLADKGTDSPVLAKIVTRKRASDPPIVVEINRTRENDARVEGDARIEALPAPVPTPLSTEDAIDELPDLPSIGRTPTRATPSGGVPVASRTATASGGVPRTSPPSPPPRKTTPPMGVPITTIPSSEARTPSGGVPVPTSREASGSVPVATSREASGKVPTATPRQASGSVPVTTPREPSAPIPARTPTPKGVIPPEAARLPSGPIRVPTPPQGVPVDPTPGRTTTPMGVVAPDALRAPSGPIRTPTPATGTPVAATPAPFPGRTTTPVGVVPPPTPATPVTDAPTGATMPLRPTQQSELPVTARTPTPRRGSGTTPPFPRAPTEPGIGRVKPPSQPIEVIAEGAPTDPDNEVVTPEPVRKRSEISGTFSIPDVDASGEIEKAKPSVIVSGTRDETAAAIASAAAAADRDRLMVALREHPNDPALLLALLAHLGDREPTLRRNVLEGTAHTGRGRAQAIALYELAQIARNLAKDPVRATNLLTRAHNADPTYSVVWMPLADALVANDDLDGARSLYEKVAASDDYDRDRRAFAAARVESLGRDESIVSGEIGLPKPKRRTDLDRARELADKEEWPAAIASAEAAAAASPKDPEPLELLEALYIDQGDITAASEAIGRQLVLADDPLKKAQLWRRRAKLYRDALGREAEAYRCLKEAHACAPVDPEIAYQLRTAAMVRNEWALAASLLYREIAATHHPRDRGALHLELALIYDERLHDAAQAQVNYEQALAFDPTIPAAKQPLAKRYETIGRFSEAARLYEEAATNARAGDRASLLEAAARCRSTASGEQPSLGIQLERAEAMGDLEAALDLAHQLWRSEPGHPAAFRVLANLHRNAGDLPSLTELTKAMATSSSAPEDRAAGWLEVARLAEELGALDQAARAYDHALIEDPGHANALDARGALAFRLGDFATADLIYRDLGPGESVLGDDELALRRSVIAEHLGRDTEALVHAQDAAAAAPGRRDLMTRVQDLATRTGDLPTALVAARAVLDLVPLDDDDAQITAQFALVELLRQVGNLDAAVLQLERIVRDHPQHEAAIEALSDVHVARGDWQTATRYLFQLVPLAPTASARAERLYRLGEAVLVHLGDIDRADDVFLRASDLDPSHVPTLRRLLDVYWRADDPGAIVEVASELAGSGALAHGPVAKSSLAQALIAAALLGDTQLAASLNAALGDDAPSQVAAALADLADRNGRLKLSSAGTAIAELARRGMLDLAKVRAATAGTPAAGIV
jgi:tetratricopeptide (TPR) repeat protein